MFFKKFENLIITISDKIFFYKENKLTRYLFVFFFNLISFLFRSKNRILIKNNYYYNTEKKWRFFHRKQGLMAYGFGFKKEKTIY